MAQEKISRELATEEIEKILTKRKMYPTQREDKKDSIECLIEAIIYGDLFYDEDKNTLTHKLLFPLEPSGIKELVYTLRVNDVMLKPHLTTVKTGDVDGRLLAYIAALTSQPKGLMALLDSSDKKIALAVAVLFL